MYIVCPKITHTIIATRNPFKTPNGPTKINKYKNWKINGKLPEECLSFTRKSIFFLGEKQSTNSHHANRFVELAFNNVDPSSSGRLSFSFNENEYFLSTSLAFVVL